jgi:tetrahydromethanopterin S-methyltransferase subunit G
MAKQIGEETKITLDLKTIGIILFFIATVIGMWFSLQADIDEAKSLPEPEIQRIEFQMKDEAIRDAIINTQDDVEEIKEQLKKIDERLFDLQKRN